VHRKASWIMLVSTVFHACLYVQAVNAVYRMIELPCLVMRPIGLGAVLNFSHWLDRQDQSLTRAVRSHSVWKDAVSVTCVSPLPEASVVQQQSTKPTSATKFCRILFLEVLLLLIAWENKQAPLFLSLHDAAGTEVAWDWALFQPPAEDMAGAACLLSYLTDTDAGRLASSWASIMRKLDSCKRGQVDHVSGRRLVCGGLNLHASFTVTDRHAASGTSHPKVQRARAGQAVAMGWLAASRGPAASAAVAADGAPPAKRSNTALLQKKSG
jgi:hypothetical protein